MAGNVYNTEEETAFEIRHEFCVHYSSKAYLISPLKLICRCGLEKGGILQGTSLVHSHWLSPSLHSRLWNTTQSAGALIRWECTHEPMRTAGIVNCYKACSNLLIWGWTDWLNGSSTFFWTSVSTYPWPHHPWCETAVIIAVGLH